MFTLGIDAFPNAETDVGILGMDGMVTLDGMDGMDGMDMLGTCTLLGHQSLAP